MNTTYANNPFYPGFLKISDRCFPSATSSLTVPRSAARARTLVPCSVMSDLSKNGMGMLVITHEMQFAREVSDKVVFMAEGNVQEEGSPEEIFEAPGLERTRMFLRRTMKHYY